MGAYKYVEELWKKKQCDVLRYLLRVRAWQYRQQTKVCRCTRPTRHDKAHKLGFKAKEGYCIYRSAVRRGSRKRPNHRGVVYGKPKNQGINKMKFARNLQARRPGGDPRTGRGAAAGRHADSPRTRRGAAAGPRVDSPRTRRRRTAPRGYSEDGAAAGRRVDIPRTRRRHVKTPEVAPRGARGSSEGTTSGRGRVLKRRGRRMAVSARPIFGRPSPRSAWARSAATSASSTRTG